MGDIEAKNPAWQAKSALLNREFGGKTLKHCDLHNLNGGIFAVIPGSLKACTSATHAKGAPSICEYKKPALSIDEYLGGLANIIRENQKDDGPCVGCRYLNATTLPERFVANCISRISLHDFCGCNSGCVYCGGSEYFLPTKFVATFNHKTLFENLLEQELIDSASTIVVWGGGEPTLVETFEETVDFLQKNRFYDVINTSGIKFSPVIEMGLREQVVAVRISIDSGTNETYAKVKRTEYCNDVWETIRRYAATGGNFIVKYILFSMNSDIEEVDAFIERCERAGVKQICISADARSIYAIDSLEKSNPRITLKELVAAALMYNLAKAKKMEPSLETLWTSEHVEKIKQIGNIVLS